MRITDPIGVLAAANPLPASDVAALDDSPAREAIRETIDWRRSHTVTSDVAVRSWRPAMIAIAAAVALGLPALAFSGVLDSLFGFSNQGTSVNTSQLDLNDAQILEHDNVDVGAGVKLLATRDGQSFYAARASDGRICLLNGPAGGTAPTTITIGTPCERGFPSPQHPILGMYVLVRKAATPPEPGQPQLIPPQSVAGLHGLAADGIASVEAIDANGNVILQAPVTDNVYDARLDPQNTVITVPAAKIVALDANGNVVYTELIPQPANGG
jgi:hypothetical protein